MVDATVIATEPCATTTGEQQENTQKEPPKLLSLPDELILAVIEQIDSVVALASLAATNSRLQELVEPYSLRSRFVRTGVQARKLAGILQSRPKRMLHVQDLSIRYVWENEEGIEELDGIMRKLTNLRHLTIESPCLNNDPWRNDPLLPWNSHCRIDYTDLIKYSAYPSPDGTFMIPHLQSRTLHRHILG